MTVTLQLTPEQEAKVRDHALAAGVDPEAYIGRLIDEAPTALEPKGLLPGETLLDALRRVGFVDAFDFPPRPDGRAWSEVEGFE